MRQAICRYFADANTVRVVFCGHDDVSRSEATWDVVVPARSRSAHSCPGSVRSGRLDDEDRSNLRMGRITLEAKTVRVPA